MWGIILEHATGSRTWLLTGSKGDSRPALLIQTSMKEENAISLYEPNQGSIFAQERQTKEVQAQFMPVLPFGSARVKSTG